jgi:diguanylate cyclase (GGDEF)-like protein/PAS domain S-box-containing protein
MTVQEQLCGLAARFCDAPMATISISPETVEASVSREAMVPAAQGASRANFGLGEDAAVHVCAAIPLRSRDGARLGTLRVFDTSPRTFTQAELGLLSDIARLIATQLALETEAAETQAQLAALNEASPSAIIFTSKDGTIVACNSVSTRLLGYGSEQLVGKRYALSPPDGIEETERWRQFKVTGEAFHGFETRRLTEDGRALNVSISAAPVRDAGGDIKGTVVVIDDLTKHKQRRELERRLLEGFELVANDATLPVIFRNLVESVESGIPGGICTILLCKGSALEHAASGSALPALWVEAIGLVPIGPSEESCGTTAYFGRTIIIDDIASDPRWETPRPLALALGLRACWSVPVRSAHGIAHGTLAVYSDRPRHPTDDQLRVMHDAANLASIAIEGTRTRERLEFLASRDTLTGLPNRALFEERLGEAVESAKRNGTRIFVGLLDLDRFKVINDTLGHSVGDQILVEVANRLQSAIRQEDMLARLGGDEFLFLLTGVEDQLAAEGMARRALSELARSFSLSGNDISIQASLGFSSYPDDATEPSQLLRHADRAMYQVKAQQSSVGFYQKHVAETLPELPFETALNLALENDEFILLYEPQVDRDNLVRVAEAQLQWNHPELGPLTRDRFIASVEEHGVAVPIGAWMLKEACRFARRWKDDGGFGCVAVNLSARQWRARDFASSVLRRDM